MRQTSCRDMDDFGLTEGDHFRFTSDNRIAEASSVVEDERIVAMILRQKLPALGYEVPCDAIVFPIVSVAC
jgi:hypothetical protein